MAACDNYEAVRGGISTRLAYTEIIGEVVGQVANSGWEMVIDELEYYCDFLAGFRV
jgi:hypothetical protein